MCLEQGEQKEKSPRFLTAQKDGNETCSGQPSQGHLASLRATHQSPAHGVSEQRNRWSQALGEPQMPNLFAGLQNKQEALPHILHQIHPCCKPQAAPLLHWKEQ